jgi:hypothetical protein
MVQWEHLNLPMYDFLLIFPLKKTAASNMCGSCGQRCQYRCAVSLTPPTTGERCHWHRPPLFICHNFFYNKIGSTEQLAKMFEKIDWSAVLWTWPTTGKRCHWHHRQPAVSGVIDTADHKIRDFNVEFLGEYESILKKCGWVAQEELFDGKQTRGLKSRDTVPFKKKF